MPLDSLIVDFNSESSLKTWLTIDDGVMGGRSRSTFTMNEEGNAAFLGNVSLENNGGFCSVRNVLQKRNIGSFGTISLRVKGDGNRYQFRVKSSRSEEFSYVYYFETSGTWQWIEIPLAEMYPTWRGRKLDYPNYPGQTLEEISLFIGNGRVEEFKMEIDQIRLR